MTRRIKGIKLIKRLRTHYHFREQNVISITVLLKY